MREYQQKFMKYITEHIDELKYSGENYEEYSIGYVFKLPSPKKFLGIFRIKYRFIIYDKPDNIEQHVNKIDADTFYQTGVTFWYAPDTKEFMDMLSKKFKEIYVKYWRDKAEQNIKEML